MHKKNIGRNGTIPNVGGNFTVLAKRYPCLSEGGAFEIRHEKVKKVFWNTGISKG